MMFQFDDLTPDVRRLMLEEFEADAAAGRHHLSPRFTDAGRATWPYLMRDAIREHGPEWLAAELDRTGAFVHAHPQRHGTSQQATRHRTPENASEVLAEGEFNRYYVRAVCRAAIARGGDAAGVEVYRGKPVTGPRERSAELVGQQLRAAELLADLRENIPNNKLGVPGGYGSGLTVRLIRPPAAPDGGESTALARPTRG